MAMVTHTGGPFEPAGNLSGGRGAAGTGAYAHRAMVKRFCMRALTGLIVGGFVAGIIALKVAFVLSRLNY